jgi:hypothetical protein
MRQLSLPVEVSLVIFVIVALVIFVIIVDQ